MTRFYARCVFPWLCELTLGQARVAKRRRELLSQARGEILEIGLGTGLNLPHYPPQVTAITALDPSPTLCRRAVARAQRRGIHLDKHVGMAEAIPFGDGRFDALVCTFTLCSVSDPQRVMAEIWRVLGPGGQLLLLEHGLSPDPGVQKWQRRLNRWQGLLAENCHLTRDVRSLVETQPFPLVELREFYLERAPKTHGWLTQGVATK